MDTRKILDLWERGIRMRPLDRAVEIAAALHAPWDSAACAQAPVGERDRVLLRAWGEEAGGTIHGAADCPQCSAPLVFDLAVHTVLQRESPGPAEAPIELDGRRVRVRAPSSADLMAALEAGSGEAARERLIERCVRPEDPTLPDMSGQTWSADARRLLAEAIADRDPLADLEIQLTCSECGADWTAPLDIAEFWWLHISTLATRLIAEVALLAARFGWSEADILDMSAWRRAQYLQAVGR